MKKILYLLVFCTLILSYSCSDSDDDYKTFSVSVQLVYPANSGLEPTSGIKVTLTDTNGRLYDTTTNSNGLASFIVPAGVYNVSVTDKRAVDGYSFYYNGVKSNIAVTDLWTGEEPVNVDLTETKTGQIVIKELYVGGCPKDDNSGVFQMDKYVVLYNNSDQPASLENLCLGMAMPYNAHGSANHDYVGESLIYESAGWIPAGQGIWYFPNNVTIEPGKDLVIALNGAIDHTQTYSQSINFSNADYYCTYDTDVYNHTSYYPAPSSVIPSSHYLQAEHYGLGNGWALSGISPAFFVFKTDGVSPTSFVNNPANENYYKDDASSLSNARRKVPVEWILDGIEVFTTTATTNKKRLTVAVDGGKVYFENKKGYTVYRNVDKEATEAIEGNKGKLVYNYDLGTEVDGNPSTDLSGIDAEASLRNGARIVYMDTNNSSNDFHQRKKASLRN